MRVRGSGVDGKDKCSFGRWVLLPALLLVTIMACEAESNPKTVDPGMTIITEFGDYVVKGSGYRITVSESKDKTLQYIVTAQDGRILIENKDNPSIYQRWCIFLDEDDRLWVWSSDIGGSLWSMGGSGVYEPQEVVGQKQVLQKMPQRVWEYLPETIRERWKGNR